MGARPAAGPPRDTKERQDVTLAQSSLLQHGLCPLVRTRLWSWVTHGSGPRTCSAGAQDWVGPAPTAGALRAEALGGERIPAGAGSQAEGRPRPRNACCVQVGAGGEGSAGPAQWTAGTAALPDTGEGVRAVLPGLRSAARWSGGPWAPTTGPSKGHKARGAPGDHAGGFMGNSKGDQRGWFVHGFPFQHRKPSP